MSQLLDALYDDLEDTFYSKRGHIITAREVALVEATGGSSTYGEITGEGVQQFLQAVPLQPDDVLVDLGSGLGRLVLQAACSLRLRRCVGIELSSTRHEQACWVAQRLGELAREADESGRDPGPAGNEPPLTTGSYSIAGGDATFSLGLPAASSPEQNSGPSTSGEVDARQELLLSPVELQCSDLLTADLRDGSAFFLCSTAFSAAACRAVAERLAAHPRFRLLVTSRALPFPSPLMQLGQFPCSFTWTASGTAYVYVRSLQEAPAPLLAAFLSSGAPEPPEVALMADLRHAVQAARAGGSDSNGNGNGARGGFLQIADAAPGGLAWLPSLSTMTVVPGDLMV
ncbi:hypothetical protein GPECTOR_51g732 [Gonium pectorale]|uniref:Histone-lysine N-methyltransferase, H3 lysine-79 specific n=1 Tax=Gonium pectorale TaxID=33097 RepID=A0A150G7A3_GONPE|nr:hypothetical protein GPECTOR_51g732 [Gonium pectorale]|eukprot:KXZ45746.1 hypothetical protein GPECTOR_51g732 [Gonium pectorale]